jgi:hypothetical protein
MAGYYGEPAEIVIDEDSWRPWLRETAAMMLEARAHLLNAGLEVNADVLMRMVQLATDRQREAMTRARREWDDPGADGH